MDGEALKGHSIPSIDKELSNAMCVVALQFNVFTVDGTTRSALALEYSQRFGHLNIGTLESANDRN